MRGGLQGCLKYSGSCLLPSPWGKLAASLSVPLLLPLHPSFCFQTASACRGYRLLQGTEFRKELIQPHHFSSCFATFLNLLYWGGALVLLPGLKEIVAKAADYVILGFLSYGRMTSFLDSFLLFLQKACANRDRKGCSGFPLCSPNSGELRPPIF